MAKGGMGNRIQELIGQQAQNLPGAAADMMGQAPQMPPMPSPQVSGGGPVTVTDRIDPQNTVTSSPGGEGGGSQDFVMQMMQDPEFQNLLVGMMGPQGEPLPAPGIQQNTPQGLLGAFQPPPVSHPNRGRSGGVRPGGLLATR